MNFQIIYFKFSFKINSKTSADLMTNCYKITTNSQNRFSNKQQNYNKFLNMLCKRLIKEFLLHEHDEYNSTSSN